MAKQKLNPAIRQNLMDIKRLIVLMEDNLDQMEERLEFYGNYNLGTLNNLLPEVRKICSRTKRLISDKRFK